MKQRKLVIGTRGSALALAQTHSVAQQLVAHHPSLALETRIIRTQGDKNPTASFAQIGGKGIFTKEIEQALLDGTVDLAVHSLKDLPNELPQGLMLAAVPEREDAHDVLVVKKVAHDAVAEPSAVLSSLREGAVVGTSSLRRRAQLLRQRPDVKVVELRGNVDTRLRKLESQNLDAIMLAAAGLRRLGKLGGWEVGELGNWEIGELGNWEIGKLESWGVGELGRVEGFPDFLVFPLPFDGFLPDPGQGALAIECRAEDVETLMLLQPLNHPDTFTATAAERAFVRAVGGSCRVPIGALATIENDRVCLCAMIASPDGKEYVKDTITGNTADAEELGRELGKRLLRRGGQQILQSVQ
ncbi:MAG: hydroxymethylbilane synthase [Abditibacteriales bacterium]|nr:hydroxymethylbilane synthase [Abditibacteriales bacterium]MDW8367613.1 hydroxymethylbilane synthase [Abditibacteriales bacterium]